MWETRSGRLERRTVGEFRTRSEHVKFNCFLRYIGSRFEQPGDLSSVAYRDEVARAADRARYMVAYHVPVHWHFEAAGGCLAAFHIAVSLTLSLSVRQRAGLAIKATSEICEHSTLSLLNQRARANENKPPSVRARTASVASSGTVWYRLDAIATRSESVLNHFQLFSITLNHRESVRSSGSLQPVHSRLAAVLRSGWQWFCTVLHRSAPFFAAILSVILRSFSDFSNSSFELLELLELSLLNSQSTRLTLANSKLKRDSPDVLIWFALCAWMLLIVWITFNNRSQTRSHTFEVLPWNRSSQSNSFPFNSRLIDYKSLYYF